MKKFTRMLSLLLIAAMLCVMLVSCADKPNEDPEEAKAALRGAGYIVMGDELDEDHPIKGEYLLIAVKLGDLDIDIGTIATMDEEEMMKEMEEMEGETMTIEFVCVAYFENEDDAEDWYEDGGEEYMKQVPEGFAGDVLKTMKEELEEYDITLEFEPGEVTLDGCMVYIGTPNALRDAS